MSTMATKWIRNRVKKKKNECKVKKKKCILNKNDLQMLIDFFILNRIFFS